MLARKAGKRVYFAYFQLDARFSIKHELTRTSKEEAHDIFRSANLGVHVLGDVVVDKQHAFATVHVLGASIPYRARIRACPAHVAYHLRL